MGSVLLVIIRNETLTIPAVLLVILCVLGCFWAAQCLLKNADVAHRQLSDFHCPYFCNQIEEMKE